MRPSFFAAVTPQLSLPAQIFAPGEHALCRQKFARSVLYAFVPYASGHLVRNAMQPSRTQSPVLATNSFNAYSQGAISQLLRLRTRFRMDFVAISFAACTLLISFQATASEIAEREIEGMDRGKIIVIGRHFGDDRRRATN